jgi:hypothetical protein
VDRAGIRDVEVLLRKRDEGLVAKRQRVAEIVAAPVRSQRANG